jgi:hypothetical protein
LKATTCPHCGAPRKAGGLDTTVTGNARTCLGCILWPLILLIVAGIVAGIVTGIRGI